MSETPNVRKPKLIFVNYQIRKKRRMRRKKASKVGEKEGEEEEVILNRGMQISGVSQRATCDSNSYVSLPVPCQPRKSSEVFSASGQCL